MSGPFCLLHGFAGLPASWAAVVALLPAESVVLRPALLGHRAADAMPNTTPDATTDLPAEARPDPRPFEREADRIAGLIEEAGLRGVHLCGYSLGGRVALALLLRRSELFSRATLIGVHPGLASGAERTERWDRDQSWAALAERSGIETFITQWEAQPLFASQHHLPVEVRAAQHELRRGLDPAGLARCLHELSLARMPDYRQQLPRLDLPVHLLVGEDDEKFRSLAESMTSLLPQGRLTVVSQAGHNVPLEQPQAVAAALIHAEADRQVED